jgi:putative hemolysin
MAAEATRVTVTWVDAALRKVRAVSYFASSVLNPAVATITAIVALMQAISKAYPEQIATSVANVISGSAASGVYGNAEDKVLFTAKDIDGQAMNFKIPGPLPSIFKANTVDIDPANSLVIALATAIDTYCVTQGGTTVVTSVGSGKRLRIKQLKH